MTISFEINFRDLNEDAQKRYLEFQWVTDSYDLNTDGCPLAIVEVEEDLVKINDEQECEFTSVWDDGSIVVTPCVYHPKTGQVFPDTAKGPSPEGSLVKEFISLDNGDELPVCDECHEYVTKVVMVEGVGKTLYETIVCRGKEQGVCEFTSL